MPIKFGEYDIMKLIQNIINALIAKGILTKEEAEDILERAK
ncbi:hypothetical protein ACFLU8_02950 [Chloroflexota bacterium]